MRVRQEEKCRQYARLGLEWRLSNSGENHPDTAPFLKALARSYLREGDEETAETCFLQALDAQRKVSGIDSGEFGEDLLRMAQYYQKRGQEKKLQKLFNSTLRDVRSELGRDHPWVIYPLCVLALSHAREASFEQSGRTYEEALRVVRNYRPAEGRQFPRDIGKFLVLPLRSHLGAGRAARAFEDAVKLVKARRGLSEDLQALLDDALAGLAEEFDRRGASEYAGRLRGHLGFEGRGSREVRGTEVRGTVTLTP